MADMLTQEEINALLGTDPSAESDIPEDIPDMSDISAYVDAEAGTEENYDDILSNEQKDVLGEIGNISMGTAATTMYALLNQKVQITTPKVKVVSWKTLSGSYDRPCVGIRVDYKVGLKGSNILILKERDVKIIANLMMGGVGDIDDSAPLTDLDLSAIGEAMNQMVGSSSTSLSSLIKEKIDINTPQPFVLDFQNENYLDTIDFASDEAVTCVAFRMEIGELIDSEIMQILPVQFAVNMVNKLKEDMMGPPPPPEVKPAAQAAPPPPAAAPEQPAAQAPQPQAPQAAPPPVYAEQPAQPYPPPGYAYPPPQPMYMPYPQAPFPQAAPAAEPNVNVHPAQFQNFDMTTVLQQKENMGIIMDVPLEVTVELGRTGKKIKEILEFAPGTIIELDKLAGEPIDILVNGKFVAKGEVIVIDENFGIRITDIISAEKRI